MMRRDHLHASMLAALLAGMTMTGALAQTADDAAGAASDAAGAASDAAGAADTATQPDAGQTAPVQSDTSADTQLPEIDVIQDTPQQRRAKKKQVAVSPLSQSSAAPAAPGASATTAAAGSAGDGEPADVGLDAAASVTLPSSVTTVTSEDISGEGTKQVQKVLEQQVPSVTLSDAAGNPARAELSFRGFDASPVNGRSQGLAIYQNGVRINEAFGDTVNWSFIPTNAIEAISVVSNNPAFGLNAVGGAASIAMKDGFSYQGAEFDVMIGSFGRVQTAAQAGATNGNVAAYAALEGIWEDGFRDFSETEVRRFFGDIGLRGSMAEVHVSLTAASNEFGATSAAPVELLDRRYANTFTSPQTSELELFMPTISGTLKATDTLTLSAVAYYRRYNNSVIDGNVSEAEECTATPAGGNPANDYLCLDEGDPTAPVRDASGNLVEIDDVSDDEDLVGSIERLDTKSRSWGAAFEAQEKSPLFGRPNQLVVGVSYDHGKTNYKTTSELGQIGNQYVVTGSGITAFDDENELSPRNLNSENTYWGIYFSNAFEMTDQLTVTVGGRYNHATIKLEDLTGAFPELNATNSYERFNPLVGANYKLLPGLSLYGGYSESNRAPTPAELGCAEPDNPCLIESFLTDDPPLDQVVGRTAEIGLRGQGSFNGGQFSWGAGLFRTMSENDILPVTDPTGRVFFLNGGDTLRQGIELYARYGIHKKWNVYGSYALIDATLDKCSQPDAVGECAFLRQGDRLPGISRHLFKAGFEYWITSKWKFGADLIAASKRPFFRNQVARDDGRSDSLAGYTRVDLHTSYDVTEKFQVYGFVKNLFDQKYALYGTYFEADEVTEVDQALGGAGLNDPRTISPSQPFALYGGVKVKF